MKIYPPIPAQKSTHAEMFAAGDLMRSAVVTQRPGRFQMMGQVMPRAAFSQETDSASGESGALPAPGLKPPISQDDMRRSWRILWPIPIRVTGTDYRGVSFIEDTVTVSVNQQGARISLTHPLLFEDVILIMNPRNGIEEEFRVVRECQKVFGQRQEWCVEAMNANSSIWGIDFNQLNAESKPMVLMACEECKNTAYTSLTLTEYLILLSVGMISHHCNCCGNTTRWKPRVDAPLAGGSAVRVRQATSGLEMRKTRRLEMTMNVFVRNGNGIAEMVQTRDVSKGGLCFVGSKDFKVGDDIYITFPFADTGNPADMKGKICWSAQESSGRSYGVKYVEGN